MGGEYPLPLQARQADRAAQQAQGVTLSRAAPHFFICHEIHMFSVY
jgi:hypothetical protein